jgi:hypothetical protein
MRLPRPSMRGVRQTVKPTTHAHVRTRGVPGVMQAIGFPDEGLPDSSAFLMRASEKCEIDDFDDFHTLSSDLTKKSPPLVFPIPPPKTHRIFALRMPCSSESDRLVHP